MIRRVKIEGYKSLRSVQAELKPITVLFGPNASGKSNFLDALQLLKGIVTKPTLNEAFEGQRGSPLEAFTRGTPLQPNKELALKLEVEVEATEGVVKGIKKSEADFAVSLKAAGLDAEFLQVMNSTGRPTPILYSDFLAQGSPHARFRYHCEILGDRRTGSLTVQAKRADALGEDWHPLGVSYPDAIAPPVGPLPIQFRGLMIPSVRHGNAVYAPATVLSREMTDWRFYNIDPFLIREDRVLRESNEIGSRGEGFAAFINSLCVNRPKLFDAYRRSLCSLIPSIESVTVSPRDDGELDVRLVQDGTEQSIRVISEGTLRLMGLLAIAYMPEPPTLLGFEEPENGVHPGRLELIAEIFKSIAARGTQVVLTTHSPYLPEMFDKESLLVCRRGENGTVLQPYLSLDPLGNPLPPGEYLKDADDPDATPISQRILRGDFGD